MQGANEAVVSFGLADVPITGATPAKRAYPVDTAFVRARPDESIVRDFYGEPASPVAPSQRSTGEAASDHVAASQTETETEIEAEANSDDADNDRSARSLACLIVLCRLSELTLVSSPRPLPTKVQ